VQLDLKIVKMSLLAEVVSDYMRKLRFSNQVVCGFIPRIAPLRRIKQNTTKIPNATFTKFDCIPVPSHDIVYSYSRLFRIMQLSAYRAKVLCSYMFQFFTYI